MSYEETNDGRGAGPAHAKTSRRARRKERAAGRSKGQRWRRRLVASVSVLVVLVLALAGGAYWYVNYRLDQATRIKGLAGALHQHAKPGKPFDVLLVGSDSRKFEKNGSAAFGSASVVTGQRSDVTIIARVIPATQQIYLLSIPRDTLVHIPGHIPYISGENRINAAFNNGPGLLIKTIEQDFGIPIEHFAAINFAGFRGMVNAVGGIKIDFPYQLKDAYSQLHINHTGCQLIRGNEALAYVRSRHLYYLKNGSWYYDGLSDWSRIRRQDVFFHALVEKVKGEALNPAAMNDLLLAVVRNLAIDSTFSNSALLNLVYEFRHAGVGSLHSEVLPTVPYVTPSGADVLKEAPGPDRAMVKAFLAEGTKAAPAHPKKKAGGSTGSSTSSTTSTVPSSTTTTTTNPNIVYDTQPEPWNGTPC